MLLPKLLGIMPTEFVPFETRKKLAAIFNFLLTGPISDVFSEYTLLHYHDLMTPLCSGIDSQSSPDTSLLCGAMFRSTLKHNALYKKLLDSFLEEQTNANMPNNSKSEISPEYELSSMPQVDQPISLQQTTCRERYLYPLMDRQVFVSNFDLASDALTTLREIFTSNTEIASEYLERDYDTVFAKYNIMLQSESYVTKRMSLKLLGELLLNRNNFNVMMKYISNRENLKIIMVLLSDPSKNIQFEAFHVFKIFVANPNKPPQIAKVLAQNKVKLVSFLEQFHKEKEFSDVQFRDEKTLLISTLLNKINDV